MEHAARVRGRLAGVGAAPATPVEVPEQEDVARRAPVIAQSDPRARSALAPETPEADRPRHEHVDPDGAEERDHRVVGQDGVEGARTCVRREERLCEDAGQGGKNGEARRSDEGGRDAVAFEGCAERARPGMVAIGTLADLLERLRHVHSELVRRRVLAMVVAGAAVVAEVRKVGELLLGESGAQLHGREDGAVPFAIAARIADHHDPFTFGEQVSERHALLPSFRRYVRRRSRWSFRTRRCSPGRGCCRP